MWNPRMICLELEKCVEYVLNKVSDIFGFKDKRESNLFFLTHFWN